MKRPFLLWFVAALVCGCLTVTAQITPNPWVRVGPRGDLTNPGQTPGVNGRVRTMQIVPVGDNSRVYIGASGGGVWRAIGSLGSVWTDIGSSLPNPSVGALAVHPSDANDILVGTGDLGNYDVASGQGFYHTVDGGASWSPVSSFPYSPKFFFRLLYLPGNASVILAATSQGLFRSSNGLNGPWQVALSGDITDLIIRPDNPQIQFCARYTVGTNADGGIYESFNAGQTWNFLANTGAPATNFGIARISICRDSPDTMAFVHTSSTNFPVMGVFRSTNAGTNWSDVTPQNTELDTEGFRALAIAFRPNNPQEIIVAANNIWRTFDGGQTWNYNSDTNGAANNTDHIKPHQDIAELYFSSAYGDNILWQCSDGGVFAVDLSVPFMTSWNGVTDDPSSLQVSTVLDMDAVRNIRVIGNQDDQTAVTLDDGGSWTNSGCCDVPAVTITADLSPVTYWFLASSAPPKGRAMKWQVGSTAVNVSDPSPLVGLFYNRFQDRVYSVDTNSVLLSQSATATLPGAWRNEGNLPSGSGAVTGDRLNGKTLFTWTGSEFVTVLKENLGNWSIVRSARIGTNATSTNAVLRVIASTERVGESWAVMSGEPRILHTLDEWQTWNTNAAGNFEAATANANISDLAVKPFSPQVMFAATDRGVFATENRGTTWQAFQTGMPIVAGNRLRYATDFNHTGVDKLVVATYGHGVYEREIPRLPLVYVDQRNTDYRDGSFEHPFHFLVSEGLATTPAGGMMALNGTQIFTAPATLTKPMTITAYEAPAVLTH